MRPRHILGAAAALVAATTMVGSQALLTETAQAAGSVHAADSARAVDGAKKKSSWSLSSEVNFNGSSLADGCVSYSGKYAAGNSAWSSKNVTMGDGELTMKVEKKKTDGQTYTTGGFGCWDWAQKYGKWEIKAKVPSGQGINSYITLSPSSDDDNALTSIELLAPGTDTAYVSNGYGKGSEQAFSEQDFADKKFHTYTIEWAPKHLLVRLDGDEIFYSDKAYTKARWISMATTTGDELTGSPNKKTKLPASFVITQMKTYKYTGVKPTAGETLSTQTDASAAGATPSPSVSGEAGATPEPSASATPLAAENTSGSSGDSKLTGGVWPWLIGGSVMAVTAIGILSYPGRRKQQPARRS